MSIKTKRKRCAHRKQRRLPRMPRDRQLRALVDMSSNWYYWEQDDHYRFTRISGAIFEKVGIDPQHYLGKTRRQLGWLPLGDAQSRDEHLDALEARQPFNEVVLRYVTPQGAAHFISTSGQPVFDRAGRFKGYRGISRDITRRVQIEQRLTVEREVARALAQAHTVAQAGTRIIQLICETLGWECGAHWEIDAQTQRLACAHTWGAPRAGIDDFLSATRQLAALDVDAEGLVRQTCAKGEPVWITNVTEMVSFRRADNARRAGLRGAFAFPIKAGGGVIGAMEFFSRDIHEPDAELLKGAVYLGDSIGQFCQRSQAEEQLLRFRGAMDLSGDAIYLVDRATMRFVDVNETACRAAGLTRAQMLAMGPQDLLMAERADIERIYDEIIAKGSAGVRSENSARARDGRVVVVELHRRALCIAGRWMIVTISRDITRRKRAEAAAVRVGNMYSALSATNEAIVRAASPEELLQRVCDAAVHGGRFRSASVLLPDGDSLWMRVVATTGVDADIVRTIRISIDPERPEGRGLVGTAFRTGEPCVSNDLMHDPRTQPWRDSQVRSDSRAGAALPIVRAGRAVGVLAFYAREADAFNPEAMKLLEHMAANVAYALDHFERDAERRRAEQAVRDSDERFRALTALSSDWYWEQDARFRFTRFSRHDHHGRDPMEQQVVGQRPWQRGEAEGGWDAHRRTLETHRPFRDLVVRHADPGGTVRYFSASGEPTFDARGGFAGYRGVARDITERKRAEERIQYLATHDGLTALPNRVTFSQLLDIAIETAKRYRRRIAVLFVDLDRFKVINDTLGHAAGDKLLQEIAARLKRILRASDVVARLGGDEFVVLLQEINDARQTAAAARKILSTIVEPMVLIGQECRVTASIGIATFPDDAGDEQTLMKNADIAMYVAKEEGKNNYQFYSNEIETQSLDRLNLETSLRHALARGQFALHYQAKLDACSHAITGVEALLRWHHPDLGTVAPAQFIPLAEETGLIVPIGRWVLRTACAQNVAWQRSGLPPLCMAVNLSARQFSDTNLLHDIAEALRTTGMAPELLELEITEGMVMQSAERATRILDAIKRMRVRLAIDDFGTGYSSLAQIKRFPIDTLKVDRSFIRDIPHDPEDNAITEAIIAMARSLSLTVVAEGVETAAQAEFLRAHACNEMQGYYFSKPVAPEEFVQWLRHHLSSVRA